MADFTSIASEVGTGLGSFLNPLFGGTKTTTTTVGEPTASTPNSGTKTSTLIIVAVVGVLLIAGAYLLIKKKA